MVTSLTGLTSTRLNCFYRSEGWVFGPHEMYERGGDVSDVVFPCGWVSVDDEIRIYYGSADTSISLASAKVSDILEYIRGCPETQCPRNTAAGLKKKGGKSIDPKTIKGNNLSSFLVCLFFLFLDTRSITHIDSKELLCKNSSICDVNRYIFGKRISR